MGRETSALTAMLGKRRRKRESLKGAGESSWEAHSPVASQGSQPRGGGCRGWG